MADIQSYQKRLCMTELIATHARFSVSHHFDSQAGTERASFCYVERGEVELRSLGRTVRVGEGGFFYLPEGLRYRSVWSGTPEIEQYSLHVVTAKREPRATDRAYAMQLLPRFSCPETGRRVREIFELLASEDRILRIRAIGLYYALYADVLPEMVAEPPAKQHGSLIRALDYIDAHYTEDFPMATLAAVACLSEPRLYHLFRSELGTTPLGYRTELRISRAAAELRASDRSVEEIAFTCGFRSAAYFRESFRAAIGLSPREYRRACAE